MRKTRNLLAGGESVTTTVTFSINNCLVCLVYSAYATALGVRCVYNFKQMLEFSKTAEPTTFESHLVVCVGNFVKEIKISLTCLLQGFQLSMPWPFSVQGEGGHQIRHRRQRKLDRMIYEFCEIKQLVHEIYATPTLSPSR